MTDREQAILWLDAFAKNNEPMTLIPKQLIRLMQDVLVKTEAITPIITQKEEDFRSGLIDVYCCGNCRQELEQYPRKWNYCQVCGKAVKWGE